MDITSSTFCKCTATFRTHCILTENLCSAPICVIMLLCTSCHMDVLEMSLVTCRLSRESLLVRNSNFQCCIYKSLPLNSVLSHLNPLCTFTTSFTIIILILSVCLSSSLCYLCCPSHSPWYNCPNASWS
jgi:hypothetical protein